LLFNGATALKQATTNRHCGAALMRIASGQPNQFGATETVLTFLEHLFPVGMPP
jgi:hypothetical protein